MLLSISERHSCPRLQELDDMFRSIYLPFPSSLQKFLFYLYLFFVCAGICYRVNSLLPPKKAIKLGSKCLIHWAILSALSLNICWDSPFSFYRTFQELEVQKWKKRNKISGWVWWCNASTWQEGGEFIVSLRHRTSGVWRQPQPKRNTDLSPFFLLSYLTTKRAVLLYHTFPLGTQIN